MLASICLFVLILSFLYRYVKYHRRSHAIDCGRKRSSTKLRGKVVLMKKHAMDMTDLRASVIDRLYEAIGRRVSFQLVSATVGDANDRDTGKVGEPAYLEGWLTKIGSMYADGVQFALNFEWEESQGIPGAVIVKNNHRYEFYLKSLMLEDVPGKGQMHFNCSSWVYPAEKYSYDRIFFANDAYLPRDTPRPLRAYREDELRVLRGDGSHGKLRVHDRIYDYDLYNDLGDPAKGKDYERPVLGGSKEFPYPRRGRTGRPLKTGDYIPCDEYFGHLKYSDFIAFKLKSDMESSRKGKGDEEFRTFEDVLRLYKGSMGLPSFMSKIRDLIPFEVIKELLRTDGERLLSFPLPQLISNDDDSKHSWWATDKEFARQTIAGLHPVLIRAAKDEEVQEFKERKVQYSDHICQEKDGNIQEENADGWVFPTFSKDEDDEEEEEEEDSRRFFVLDHSYVKKYQERIYEITSNISYASKTLFYLEKDGTLSPYGILLTNSIGTEEYMKRYFFPADAGVNAALWKLAKAIVAVNDSGYHQLVSHWLCTHAAMEPLVIATNRRLSVMHPIYKFLKPHLKDTMHMNSLARQILICANGSIERNFFTGKFSMSLTSDAYRSWNLMEHALPTDLLNRGVAVREGDKLRLLIDDYPYAIDGLEIWSAIETWVNDYCSIYYPDDSVLRSDTELQEWWQEFREVGHGDMKDEPWWPKMQTVDELAQTLAIIIWLASAFHAALNFGQYAYAGYVPSRPTFIRRPMPGPEEFKDLMEDPDGNFLMTITSKSQALSVMSVIEILSRHASDEEYLGQRDEAEWTSDRRAVDAFGRFRDELLRIEKNIEARNKDEKLKNRHGRVEVPYTLLYPDTSNRERVAGLTGRGIPNSVSV